MAIPETRPSLDPDPPRMSGVRRKQYEEAQKAARDSKDPQILALKNVVLAAGQLLFRVNTIKNPTYKTLQGVLTTARDLKDPELAKKAEAKFQRIFQSLLADIKVAEENAKVLVRFVKELSEKDTLTRDDMVQLVQVVKKTTPALRSALMQMDPEAHKEALNQEISKQLHFLKQLHDFAENSSSAAPEVKQKIAITIRGAEHYIEGLRAIADPEFEDVVKNAAKRALETDFPTLLKSLKALTAIFSGVEKTGAKATLRKRLRRVAKRIVLLTYLRDKS